MKTIIDKIWLSNQFNVPQVVADAFKNQYPLAYNTEWSKHKKVFEVIFYLDEQECIAGYDESGKNLFIKRNLKIENVSPLIEKVISPCWELMNLLEIEEPGLIRYECIVRNKELVRYVLNIDQDGYILNEEKL